MAASVRAQVFGTAGEPSRECVVVADGFARNWFVQADLDLSLQNPYGYDFSKVFPKGHSFGMDLAVGKWFTHQAGVRGRFNWENALPLLENSRAEWLAPFGQPGVNRERGGYLALYGDVLLNLHNLFGPYRPDRTWNLSFYPRVGFNFNFGNDKGALAVGLGLMNTWRLTERVSLIADGAYMMCGSGFTGDNESGGTGTGSNSNGYFSFAAGAQLALGNPGKRSARPGVLTGGFWDHWFVQAGADMDLINPYGYNFSKVIPRGQTFGLNAALGKRFSPEFALRGRVQWENGLIPNPKLAWVVPVEDPAENYRAGGMGIFSVEAVVNLTDIVSGYAPDRKWNTAAFFRAGIISQFVVGSASPLMGAGIEETCRLGGRLSLFGAVGYQVTTSEGLGVSGTGMGVSAGSNGYFNNDFGIILDLGSPVFFRSPEQREQAREQSDGERNWSRFLVNTAASVGVAWAAKTGLKAVVREERPDHSDDKSFPSGHATMAFAGAASLHREFGKDHPWVSVAGYLAATAVGVERIVHKRHHWYDVVAGAGLGIGMAELTWRASDRVFGKDSLLSVGCTGSGAAVAFRF